MKWKFNKKSLVYGTMILTGANFIVRTLGFVYRIVLSRIMGPQGMGLFQLIFPIYITAVSIISSGIPIAVSRLVAQQKAVKNDTGIKKVMIYAMLLSGISAVCIFVLIIANINNISLHIIGDIRTRIPLIVLSPSIIIIAIKSVFKGYFYGINNIKPPALSEIIEQIARIGTTFILFYYLPKVNYEQATIITVFGMVIGELVSLLHMHIKYRSIKIVSSKKKIYNFMHESNQIIKEIIKISIPITLTRLISNLMMTTNSILVPKRLALCSMSNEEAIGVFGIVSGMVFPLLFLPFTIISALSTVLIPNIAEDLALKNWSQIQNKISKAVIISSVTAFAATSVLLPLGDPIGIALYKQKDVGTFLVPLSIFIIFQCLQQSLNSILHGMGKQNRAAIHFIAGGTVQILCTYFLTPDPRFGIYGFIIGFIMSNIIVTLLNFTVVASISKLKIRFVHWFLKPAFACTVTASVIRFAYISFQSINISNILAIVMSVLLGMIIFVTAIWALGISSPSLTKNPFKQKKLG